ncbi:hypothetical protein WH47_01313 [Habropoda laboriosa]|uniref:CHK kinase-like domain-containing protein n=1 Tax=Habropoda laboriosa TaxID=597456 RepID=A0A0L7QZH2_9HYME|nr:PREDICTED: uncharacterized protein LOC108573631 [Habropoda laboriosa]KOC63998.1 hypothetical protein WH47_01313 [Habropoda laboriosa]
MATISADPACCLTDSTKSQVLSANEKSTAALLHDSDVNKIVERKFRSKNFCILHWSLDSFGETNGYLGQYYTLSVTVKIDNKSKHLSFFAKTPPPTSSPQYDFLVRYNTFNKEIIVYSEIVPTIGMGTGIKWIPDYYLSKSNVIMVLEDARQEGYVTPDKYLAFDEEHCVSVVKAISTFHSRSLILDEKLRRSTGQTILDLYGHVLEEVAFVAGDVVVMKYLSSCVKGACTMVDLVEGLKEDEATAMKNWMTTWIPKLPSLLVSSSKYRNVMCHRDIWPNNIMIKRDSAGKPVSCYLVDFQFLRYSPPAIDFVICLLLVTDRATRRTLYDRLVDVYYETMKKELAASSLDVEECLPREQFVASCDDVKGVSLAYSVANMQIMLLTKSAVEQYFIGSTDQLEYVLYGDERCDLVKSQCRSKKLYQTRITDVIEEIREYLANNNDPAKY